MARINFPDLDIAKLLMALLVVEIHTRPFMDFDSQLISRIATGIDCVAVPFFFIASGYLCFRGGVEVDDQKLFWGIRKTIKKLAILYCVWVVIYLPTTLFGVVEFSGSGPLKSTVVFLRNALLMGEGPYSYHLWYLHASVIGFILIYFCLKRGLRWQHILSVSALCLLAGYGIDFASDCPEWGFAYVLSDLYMKVFGNVRNGVFEGFFYVAVGMAFAVLEVEKGVSRRICWGGALLGVLGTIAVTPDAHLPFCVLFSCSVFLLSIARHGADTPTHPFLRNLSTGIYLSHMLLLSCLFMGLMEERILSLFITTFLT